MVADTLTRPERARAFAEARQIREAVVEAGGCRYCTRRAGVLETVGRRAACGLSPPLAFPGCTGRAAGFEFDEESFDG